MERNDTFAEGINLSANNTNEAVKKEWIKPEMKKLAISSAPTIWDSELETVAPVPS